MKFFRFSKKEELPSLERALKKVIGRREYEAISTRCPDRRMMMQFAAERMGKGERELLEEVASRSQLRVAPRVIKTEAESLPKGVTLSVLREAGCIAIIRDRVFRGVICTDPARVPEPYRSYEGLQLLLAPWREIVKALGESEERLEQIRTVEQADRDVQEEEALEKVLSFLVEEVERHGRKEVKLSLDASGIRYLFTTPDGRNGHGEMNENLKRPMKRFLSRERSTISERNFRIKTLERGRYYSVSWYEKEEHEKEKQETFEANPPLKRSKVPLNGDSLNGKSLLNGTSLHANGAVSDEPLTDESYTVSVLLVDDSDTFGAVVERFFIREGITVERRTCAQAALSELRSGKIRPRVVVCDIHMPVMNGVQFIRELRKCEKLSRLTLFMLTSDEEVDTELEAIQIGVEAYLRKNDDPRLLCAHVERVLKRKDTEKAA